MTNATHARFLPRALLVRSTAATEDARSQVSETDRPAHRSQCGTAPLCARRDCSTSPAYHNRLNAATHGLRLDRAGGDRHSASAEATYATQSERLRQGRTKTGGLLDAVIYVGLLVAAIALFA